MEPGNPRRRRLAPVVRFYAEGAIAADHEVSLHSEPANGVGVEVEFSSLEVKVTEHVA
jgi:hypothetical protein